MDERIKMFTKIAAAFIAALTAIAIPVYQEEREQKQVETTAIIETEKARENSRKTREKRSEKAQYITVTATAYCPCKRCCGKSDGITSSNVKAKANHTIAADISVYPYGTKMIINGIEYVVEDSGGAIKNNKIDIFFNTHQEALDFGVQKLQAKIVK